MRTRIRGFALAEALIAVMVGGTAVVAIGHLIKSANTGASAGQQQTLEAASAALLGFASAHAYLPEAEDGWLPTSLGGSVDGNRVRYFVAPALKTVASTRYNPHGLVPATKATPGLDFCQRLAQVGSDELLAIGTDADAARVAAALEYSSSAPTANEPSGVALPGSDLARSREAEGRFSRGISPAELFSALSCADRLARVAAAAKYQWAMADMVELARANTQHRRVDLQVAQAQMDESALGLAQLIVALGILTVDEAELITNNAGKKPYQDYAMFAIALSIYLSGQAQTVATIALVTETLNKWPALQQKLSAAIADADARQKVVERAFDDAKRELAYFAELGLTP
ncbi:MAG: hypothetical protein J7603_00455 [Pseudacidovorax sp.]|nr:hypothetical protein [Pseudacidovorax sp.]